MLWPKNDSHQLSERLMVFKEEVSDFPGGPVVKNPPANTGDTGSIPGLGRFHMARATKPVLQSPRAATTEPMSCNY